MFPKGFLEAVLVVSAIVYVFRPLIIQALQPAAIELGHALQQVVVRWHQRRTRR